MTLSWRLLWGSCLLLAATGCGNREAAQQLELAKRTVQKALDTWKQGNPATSLEQEDPPIEFHDDDWQLSARLLEYQLLDTYFDTDQRPRCAVQLKIQRSNGDPIELKVTYEIVTSPRIIVARDPFS